MISETFSVNLSIPLKSGARAVADIYVENGGPLSIQQALEIKKLLRSVDGEIYVNIAKTTLDDDFRP